MRNLVRYFVLVSLVVAILLVHLGAHASQARANTDLRKLRFKYDTPGSQLRGKLVERKIYGPPGYGETPSKDTRTVILILIMPREISVEPAANAEETGSPNLDPVKDIREVQLFLNHSQSDDARKLIGRNVIAIGTLNESVTASQHTKVWLDVEKLYCP